MKEVQVLEKYNVENKWSILLLFIGLAYLFSIVVRLYWPMYFAENATMHYANQLMINTNDGYYFASAARDILDGIMQADHQKSSAFHVSPGLVLLSAYATKFTPFSLETVTLYLPAIISSLIVIPIILSGRLMGHTFVGFLAALLGSITWSYYNRTMVGYYDTDMFSVLFQFTIFYGFLRLAYQKNISSVLLTAFFITLYPYFYSQGVSIVYVVFMVTIGYLLLEYMGVVKVKETNAFSHNGQVLFSAIILLSIALMITLPIEVRLILFILVFFLYRSKIEMKILIYVAVVAFLAFLFYGNIFSIIIGKITAYLSKGVSVEGLHFYQVVQTVREAGSIPMQTVANRISGSGLGLLLSIIGYGLLVMKHKPFVIALPLIGVGLFSYVGGLRFTVYAVPIAALSATYLFYQISTLFKNKKAQYAFMIFATVAMLYPNITHIIGYKVPTVLNSTEVKDLEKLKKISSPNDYTLTWWDYGYPIWFYSNTNTLIDGGKHTNDNFIISKILQTSSSTLAANLSRLSIETYVDSNYSIVADTIFKNGKEKSDPAFLLSELESDSYKLPKKTRDIYLYLPFRMLNIFPTVMLFGNLDLDTGKPERQVKFYVSMALSSNKGIIKFQNGIQFDSQKGELTLGVKHEKVKHYVVTQNAKNNTINIFSHTYHRDGHMVVLYAKTYNRFVVMDEETFKSMYVQMFFLGKYDKNLFELVVASPYSRIYKVKK